MESAYRKTPIVLAIAACVATAAMPAQAQDSQAPAARQAEAAAANDMRASKVIGMKVRNPQGEDLGKIEDVVIDVDNEKLRYAVVSLGGFLGLGDKLFTIPASEFRTGANQLVLNVDKDQLQNAPGFSRDQRPNFSEGSYRSEIDRFFFKEETTRHTPEGARLLNADELIGKDINDRSGMEAGKIEDLVVNFGNGRAYMVVQFDKKWSTNDKLLPLPFASLTFSRRPDIDPVLNVDRPQIAAARGFSEGKWPDLNAPATRKQINDYLVAFQARSKPAPNATQTGRETATGSSSGSQEGSSGSGPK